MKQILNLNMRILFMEETLANTPCYRVVESKFESGAFQACQRIHTTYALYTQGFRQYCVNGEREREMEKGFSFRAHLENGKLCSLNINEKMLFREAGARLFY